ncbi:hypothetical protein PRUB_a1973 [Pseudoalteromonas rubra]|uniref:DUF4426 domain-containing protein n=1 Tax=Pseudoalteromonas rubra TaxID=43658 RepID=A0A8T0CDP9_9GAMM|nr:hypothetical protein PRUB_a1973 [Pseudoalteromonas rubra]
MKTLLTLISMLAVLLVARPAHANNEQGGQYKQLGDWQVHYIAFPSTFIQPNIASAYGLTRSNSKAIINISVLADDANNTAQRATLTGQARNLIGNKTTLTFKEVVEGDAVYYLAQMDVDHEDTYRFEVTIRQGNTRHVLKFQQKFYVD